MTRCRFWSSSVHQYLFFKGNRARLALIQYELQFKYENISSLIFFLSSNEEGLQFQSNKETSRSVPAQGSNWVAKSQSTTSSSTTTDTTMRSTTAMSSITTSSSTNITTSSTSTCTSVSTTPPTQTSESSIKDFRRNRVTSEPNGRGITIAIGLNDGKTITRTFEKNAFFQEVYDWVGSLDDVPLHFTLQRGKEVVRHTDALNQNELLELTERSPVEMRDLLETTVSFKGNCARDVLEELSETLVDEGSEEEMKPAEKAEEKHKRKRKDNRKTTERRKKHKTERKESMK